MISNTVKDLSERIATGIKKTPNQSYTTLEQHAVRIGIELSTFMAAMELVHQNKQIQSKTFKDDIIYSFAVAKVKVPESQASWIVNNYPYPGKNGIPEFVMPFPEIDLSHIFLKTKEERDAYKAQASGRPIHMLNNHHGRPS